MSLEPELAPAVKLRSVLAAEAGVDEDEEYTGDEATDIIRVNGVATTEGGEDADKGVAAVGEVDIAVLTAIPMAAQALSP